MTTETLLVELGTEELPPKSLKTLGLALRDGLLHELSQRNLDHGSAHWFATPRRLAVLIERVTLHGPDRTDEVLGPPADKAGNAEEGWSPAAQGFARKQGVEPSALRVIDTPKGPRLGVTRITPGADTRTAMAEIITAALEGLPIARRMRWGANRREFVRPLHWIVAMLGEDSDHGEVFGLSTGNRTRGHRFHSEGDIILKRAEDYPAKMEQVYVAADFEERRAMIRRQVEVEASALKATAVIDEDLLDEVTGLVEWPVALTGSFEKRFLQVPAEALISSMKAHQKYFHLVDENGSLLPNFITIANIESRRPELVIAGNERVIRPRLADAAFFYETDKKKSLAERAEALESVVFQQQLGSLADKTRRITELSARLASLTGAPETSARRAAQLSKTDLVSEMVLEFPDMQGIAGSYYALHDGEEAEVARALDHQYRPRFAGDLLPEDAVGCTLALVDRLDTIVGIFGIGELPSGSRDPFGLRRASLAILRIIIEKQLPLDLRQCLEYTRDCYPEGLIPKQTVEQALTYIIERLRAWYEEQQITAEVFNAVAARSITVPVDFDRRVHAVQAFTRLPEATALAAANKRVGNILGKLDADYRFEKVNKDLLREPAEQELGQCLETLQAEFSSHLSAGAYTEALTALATLRAPVDDFFDNVMVNDENQTLRHNRLNLLKALLDLFTEVADISQLVITR